MQVYTELLAPTKSSRHSAIEWRPVSGDTQAAGVLTIHTDRASAAYTVEEFVTSWGRGFRMAKAAGGTDPHAESYDVLICSDPRGHRCDCRGFTFGHGRPCKHISAALALIENGWL